MTDHLPSQPKAWSRALGELTVASLRPEDGGLPAELSQYVNRSHDPLLVTRKRSAGIDRSRPGLLHTASARLRDLAQLWVIEPKTYSSPLAGEDVARVLLRTAEKSSGIPCSGSGLIHGLGPTPAAVSAVMTDGQHRLSAVKSVVHLAAGSGKTATFLIDFFDRLSRRLDRLSRDGHDPTTAELGHIADAAYALSALLLDLAQRLLTGCVKFFGRLVAVPINESSPCGVLRLAVPRVPRAPGVGQVPGPIKFALAA